MEIYKPSLKIAKVLKQTMISGNVSNIDKQKDETPFSPATNIHSPKVQHSFGKAYSILLNDTMIEVMSSMQMDQK